MNDAFTDFITGELNGFITSPGSSQPESPAADATFNRLALRLFDLQFQHNTPYARFCNRLERAPGTVTTWRQIPAMPTAGFKELELTSIPPGHRTRVFHSSGTTGQIPSRHFHCPESLALYSLSLRTAFKPHLLRNLPPTATGICLTPSPAEAPHSSLIHMLDAVRPGPAHPWEFTGRLHPDNSWSIDHQRTVALLQQTAASSTPCLIMGTAFSFVQLIDRMEAEGVTTRLPHGSRVMETGGYKGRSRTLPQEELHQLIEARLGVPSGFIVCEYGMSELSSQAYDHAAGEAAPPASRRGFKLPHWARARVVSPEDGREVDDGQSGLVEIVDLANAASVLAVRTGDLATRQGGRFKLHGRAALAEPRGCSLMAR